VTDRKHPLADEPQDGFDLIEYPCEYGFKAMCRVAEYSSIAAADVMRELVLRQVEQEALLSVATKQSKTGKFESVTLTVLLQNRSELESIYQAIAASPIVVMTL